MQTADALTNLSARGWETQLACRHQVVKALTGPGDRWTRQTIAEAKWAEKSQALGVLRGQARTVAADAAEGHRRDLFDLTRRAPHVIADGLAVQVARDAARAAAEAINDPAEAVTVLTGLLRGSATDDGTGLVKAGAIAERSYDQGWRDAVYAWVVSDVGAQRGGLTRLAALEHAERVASGEEMPDGLGPLQPLRSMAAAMHLRWEDAQTVGEAQ